MALILLVVERFAAFWTREGVNAMQHHNSVFHQILKLIPWGEFERLVARHGSDRRIRRMSTKDQLVALLYGQISGAISLREIAGGLASHANRLYHLGARPVQRSTLGDANAKRPAALFSDLFAAILPQAQRTLRHKVAETVYLIDATSVKLNALSDWAQFSTNVAGAKMHLILDADADCPVYFAVTPAKVNDITAARDMPIDPSGSYVFDLGYYDYRWWAELDAQGCRIVTRFKKNTPLVDPCDLPLPKGTTVLSDRIGHLPRRQARNRHNPFKDPVREVCVATETGKVLRLLSNDLDAPAQEIADLYTRRTAIELFFRWVKQNLKIGHFLGTTENAVRIQIAVALIAYLLLSLARQACTAIASPLVFARLVRHNIMHRRALDHLQTPHPPPPITTNQLALEFTHG
jgi:IS4 transposase